MAKVSTSSWTRKQKARLPQIHKGACLELNTRITEATPVDTGRARQSWTPTGSLRIGMPYAFSSGLSYIKPLEYGHSQQAPTGMLRINVRNWGDIVRSQV